jgi:hypothetical protein
MLLFVMQLTTGRVSGFGIREERKETNKKRSRRKEKLGGSRAEFGYLIRDFDVRSPIPHVLRGGVERGEVEERGVVFMGRILQIRPFFRTLQGDELQFEIQLRSFILNNSFLF